MPSKKLYSDYHQIPDDEVSIECSQPSKPSRVCLKDNVLRCYIFLLHLLLISYIALRYVQKEKSPTAFFNPLDAPLRYESRTIRTSFTSTSLVDHPFAGAGPEIDKKWEEILSVGIIRLTAKETSRLSFTPAKLYGGKEGEHAGFLEMIHQLHCLNRIRIRFYEPERQLDMHQFDGKHDPHFTANHDAHCFEYLRQNLMCYSDLSVLPIGWDKGHKGYISPFDASIQKTCRNFEELYQWAQSRKPEHDPPGNGGEDLGISNE